MGLSTAKTQKKVFIEKRKPERQQSVSPPTFKNLTIQICLKQMKTTNWGKKASSPSI